MIMQEFVARILSTSVKYNLENIFSQHKGYTCSNISLFLVFMHSVMCFTSS